MSTTPTARGAFTGDVSRIGTEARMGYINPGHLSRRAVIYLSDQIHLDAVLNGSVDLDTMFGFDYLTSTPFAISGEASEVTCNVVAVIAKHTRHDYDELLGIRISKSDKPEYASKIVFYLSHFVNLRQVCDEVAEVVFGHGVPFASDMHESDISSDKEDEARLAYSYREY
jgi:hypothetical protein